mmetsp:Transcript_19715/g.35697  ORF Transcript_19715/g.35697 Transcript_19715/m.35697 type:complete len:160 (+) Transcript_19715:112-591(+)
MADIAIALGLNALSFTNLPVLSTVAGIACGLMDCTSGSFMCGVLCIFASVLPFGKGYAKRGVVQFVRCGTKTRAIFRAGRVTAKVTRGTNSILGGWTAAGSAAELAKNHRIYGKAALALRKGAHSLRVAHQAHEAYHGSYGVAFCGINGIGCNRLYLLG